MLGFVSALSSAVAIMILLMSILLANTIAILLENENEINVANLIYDNPEQSVAIIGAEQGYSISAKDILPLADKDSSVRLYCTYGYNLNMEMARKYLTYNYLVLKVALKDKTIIVEQPIYKPLSKNNCVVEELSDEK
ncbi:hypothetical protein ACOGYQ_001909 [Edwardsiella piscicida]|uniref:hypothetical protein n=2 Tax=Edwardsiella piscicida TaxID=1263550 RepID=UPI001CECA58F|nr:hypothetical protein [Edwardsiella piscicida]AOP41812.2 hypothetical protein A9797_01480 [Edwardsiella piscicida]UCQ24752.1 hypothetical protein DCE91_01470 [Edwardsiella piscicida]UCQ31563.1 hypothetical protein DCF74_01495 [Edwardsiella piscicida]UCQ34891.1 hypothetical protein DCF34_01470 [Edwardsiella piscicida]UCQ44797.1 hypothetical protein DCF39_01470 [Edwardsiella piscicida]